MIRKNSPIAIAAFLLLGVFSQALYVPLAHSRAGGSRSFGSRGTRSFGTTPRTSSSRPYVPAPSAPMRPTQPYSQPYSQPYMPQSPLGGGSGLFRSFGAGMAGGFLGGMISRSMFGGNSGGYGYGQTGFGGGGGGVGLFDLLALGLIGWFIFRFFRNRSMRTAMNPGESGTNVYLGNRETPGGFPPAPEPIYGSAPSSPDLQNSGIDKEQAMDIFFQVQGAWTHRDLRPVQNLVTAEVAQYFQEQINQLKVTQRINRLENIAVRQAEVVEAWTEKGQDFATVHFLANLLDYTEDESSHQIVEGDSKTPVKFEEYWTFTKLQGEPSWRLSGVEQV